MKKNKALFTIVKNERYFLNKWLQYYRQHFNDCDIYVFDNQTSDGSTDNLPVKTFKLFNNNTYDPYWLWVNVSHIWNQLLKDYKYAMYTDVDEFVITKDGSPLKNEFDKLIENNQQCIISRGYNLIHWKVKEPNDFDFTLPMLQQRKYVMNTKEYSKVIMGNYDIRFNIGAHTAANEVWYSDTERECPNLMLIHTKLYDQKLTVERYKHRYGNETKNCDEACDQFFILNNQEDRFLKHHYPDPSYDNDTVYGIEPRFIGLKHINEYINYNHENLF